MFGVVNSDSWKRYQVPMLMFHDDVFGSERSIERRREIKTAFDASFEALGTTVCSWAKNPRLSIAKCSHLNAKR